MGENIGFWKQLAKRLEDFFAAPHGNEPKMDDRHAHADYSPTG
jgi:hypothetical protein